MMNEGEDIEALYEQYKNTGTAQQKAELAEKYLDLFSELSYDFACGKLTEDGVELLLPIVEKIEVLQETISWSLRAQVHELLMEDAEVHENSARVIEHGKLSIEAALNQLAEAEGKQQIYYEKISFCYYTLLGHLPEEAGELWEKSLQFIKASILDNPSKANWVHYFKLIYSTSGEEERNLFRPWALSLEDDTGLGFTIASSFIRYKELLEYTEPQEVFPQEEYNFWLEKSLIDEPVEANNFEISGMGHFYRKEGVRLHRIDLLERSLIYFERMFYEYSEPFAIHYITDVMEQIAVIYQQLELYERADSIITQALEWNEDKQEFIEDNFSLLLHYARFLENCYHYKGNIPRPTLGFIRTIVRQAEETGQGYYSGPYLLQARMALVQKDERLAVVYLSKALLLHELCIEDSIKEFYEKHALEEFSYLEKFLKSTLTFMKEVSEGYFFNPKIKFAELVEMSDDEVVEGWILRKAEIKARKRQ